jgi:hypothetical protein
MHSSGVFLIVWAIRAGMKMPPRVRQQPREDSSVRINGILWEFRY